ncbi:hypothetical protein D915_001067 [Fasciola hepatica]|uniref:Uncharacterized protein n=1 Tax=Fasciola hepatica TaxID=6192 RepID=A0A4E0RL47_FASHE|nr:hypothetical protein D915_001067 [Fasciola hepatica]
MLPVPNAVSGSPGSRRSSSVSTLGQTGLSTIIPLYSRAPAKKKRPAWKIVSNPWPPSIIYRRVLFVALFSSTVGSLIFLCATLNARWESVQFAYGQFFQFQSQFSLAQNRTTGKTDPRNFSVDFVAFQNGHLATANDVAILEKRHIRDPYTIENIWGMFVRLTEHPVPDAESAPKSRRIRTVLSPPLGKQRRPSTLQHTDDGDMAIKLDQLLEDDVAWVVMDFYAGIWSMCYESADIYDAHFVPYYYRLDKGSPIPPSCLSYLANNISDTKILCSQFFLKMQNNIISCVIVVYLCMASSILIGVFATVFRNVPASMVTGVLQVTSGVFVIFANCIHHTKLNRLEYEWGPCHPISKIPDELYQPNLIRVHSHWSLTVSWTSSPVFFMSSFAWFILTQLMTNENSKMLI